MPERKWTKPQADAIEAQGGSLLVSAAAGSGKTAVLVERAVRLLLDGDNPVPADRLLVVTFSNAAAAEMKQRMNQRLSAMIAEDPANTFLQRQQALLQSAQISTIHSFCLELIRQNFQHLDISPDFVLSDEKEMALFEQECARECVEMYYQEDEDGSFAALVELLGGRDDARLIETMLKIYHFSRSHPFYESWLESKRAMYDPAVPVADSPWGRSLLRYGVDTLEYCQRTMERAITLILGDAALEKGYLGPFRSDLEQIEACLKAARALDWDGLGAELDSFEFLRLGAVRGEDPVKDRVKGMRAKCKETVQTLRDAYFNATSQDFREDIADLAPKIALLFELVLDFGDALWSYKQEKRRLDFSDLEHLALRLLVSRGEDDRYTRTRQAEEIAGRFAMVMVDEYQDTNEVQDLIFTSVSDRQRNLFMVGDVKQSIYSFRQAMPEIFLRKKQVFFPYHTGQFPAKIILDTNFRSRLTVTEGVNYLFSMLMSEAVGEMEYTEEESLKCGAVYPDHPEVASELLLLEPPEDKELDTTELEAQAVAARIAAMLEAGYAVADGDKLRPCAPGDFAILMRSPKARSETYVKALTRQGISAWAEREGGYLKSREVSMVVSLLKALDNPLLDIELVAALMSPLFGFSGDDIAAIRAGHKGVPFYTAVSAASEEGDGHCSAFLTVFARLRAMAAVLPADKLLLRLYDLTDALAVARAMRLGELRVSNLQLLVEYAASYHNLGYKRLGGFVAFLARLEDRGGDLNPAGAAGGATGAVRILSIHRSKGLEFPVVFLSDTFRQFNKQDLRATAILHSVYGFACVRREEATRRQFSTVPMQAIRIESERSMLSEELRILYVALTRAKEKLIISGLSKKSLGAKLADLAGELQGGRLSPFAVENANCYADWLLMALLHHKSGAPLRELAGYDADGLLDDGNHWRFTIQTAGEAIGALEEGQAVEHTAPPDPALLDYLQERGSFVYPHLNQVRIPTKLAVSAVAKQELTASHRFAARPKFMEASGLTGAERGNAMHKFMQFADYENAKNDLEGEITRMRTGGFLSTAETESLQPHKLRRFFRGELAKRIFDSGKVLRELKFAAECGEDILGDVIEGMDSESKVVLQGVADCVFFEEDGAVILDYKTDAVKDPLELAQRYAGQLGLYRRILARSLDAPIKETILYSFSLGRVVDIFTNV